MKKIYFVLIFLPSLIFSQKDFSNQWEDLYSYNNVKDFIIVEDELFAITENAMFISELEDNKNARKFSSVNGLSGETTSVISFDEISGTIFIGYESGLIEMISLDTNEIFPLTGIRENLILLEKKVSGFYFDGVHSYVYGDFGIVELNPENKELGDAYKLANEGNPTEVFDLLVFEDVLYAATPKGLYMIDLSSNKNLANFNNWELVVLGVASNLVLTGNKSYFSSGSTLYDIKNPNTPLITTSRDILEITFDTASNSIVFTSGDFIYIYDSNTLIKKDEVNLKLATTHSFTTKKGVLKGDVLYVDSTSFGVLKTNLSNKLGFVEIHPDGPSSNRVFNISASNNIIIATYGGFDSAYNRLLLKKGIDIFNKETERWFIVDNQTTGGFRDYTKALVDPEKENRLLISTYDQGVIELEYHITNNDINVVFKTLWNDNNTNKFIPHLIAGFNTLNWVANMIVDKNNQIWIANSRAEANRVFSKFDSRTNGGEWNDFVDYEPFIDNGGVTKGFNKMFVNYRNHIFGASGRVGLLVFDANDSTGDKKIGIIDVYSSTGQIPDNEVFSVVSDEDDRVWIGTKSGLVVFDDYENIFSEIKEPAKKLIVEANGRAREFLAETQVNDIIVDNSGNKWFGTQGAGVFYTSPDAQTTFEIFNQGNSPLPSNNIVDLELDKETGRIYIVTDKGVVSFNPNSDSSSLFTDKITEIVAYPNPAIANKVGHSTIKIVAKGGGGLPEDTNVKIMDVSGKLVFEKNVKVTDANGGVVVWNKKNLSGNLVVSGVYIVLVSSPDGQENATTKIAIVN